MKCVLCGAENGHTKQCIRRSKYKRVQEDNLSSEIVEPGHWEDDIELEKDLVLKVGRISSTKWICANLPAIR